MSKAMAEGKQVGRKLSPSPSNSNIKKIKKRGSFCCSCRLSVSSSEENESSSDLGRLDPVAHAMVQERLDEMMVKGGKKKRQQAKVEECKCIIMVAVDKCSYDPVDDFRRSMLDVISSNKMQHPKGLRCLLNCYISMNAEEHRPIILRTFHEVCTNLFN